MNFLTVEDINSVLLNNQGFSWHLIDISNISDADFSDVQYDFCIVSKDSGSNGGEFIYVTIEVDSSCWTKGFYAPNSNDANFSNGKLTLAYIPSVTDFKIWLYMGNIEFNNITTLNHELENEVLNLNYKELNTSQTITFYRKSDMREFTTTKTLNTGYNLITYGSDNPLTIGYLLVNLLKSDFQFNCNQSLTVGKVNKVYLGTNTDYLPNGDMIGEHTPAITVTHEDETIPVQYDGTDYYFNLDLTDKNEVGKVRFSVNVESNTVLNGTMTNVVLNSDYETISSFNALKSACDTEGSEIIKLAGNITATTDIPIKHSIKIIGDEKQLNLNHHSIILNENITVNMEKLLIHEGNTAIKQAKNTILNLTECTFTGCTATNTNGRGACILCDITYDSLSIDNDFTTNLINCTFTNNHSAILHGGQLNITECKFHNTDITFADTNNTAFIYQVDGDCDIINSIFDIDYTSNTLCANETNIGYAQTSFMCGETATINGLTYNNLENNEFAGFFENLQNNRAHTIAKYYYPQITACVYTSPETGFENKNICYAVSGNDWIYKVNTKVTRVSSNTENTNRTITW